MQGPVASPGGGGRRAAEGRAAGMGGGRGRWPPVSCLGGWSWGGGGGSLFLSLPRDCRRRQAGWLPRDGTGVGKVELFLSSRGEETASDENGAAQLK
ncbi:hypothetical protein ZWY2020_013667 [Hordeum vulgare]|nr:hypothetical protein ZWY2020_013667 [Hordeum vulgare]